MKLKATIATIMALCVVLGTADLAEAKDKGSNSKGQKVKTDNKPGKGPKAVPPGQIKRYTRGAKLPSDLSYDNINDLSKWNLKSPGRGNRYIKVDNEILEVTEDLSTVVDAVGIVGDLLK